MRGCDLRHCEARQRDVVAAASQSEVTDIDVTDRLCEVHGDSADGSCSGVRCDIDDVSRRCSSIDGHSRSAAECGRGVGEKVCDIGGRLQIEPQCSRSGDRADGDGVNRRIDRHDIRDRTAGRAGSGDGEVVRSHVRDVFREGHGEGDAGGTRRAGGTGNTRQDRRDRDVVIRNSAESLCVGDRHVATADDEVRQIGEQRLVEFFLQIGEHRDGEGSRGCERVERKRLR